MIKTKRLVFRRRKSACFSYPSLKQTAANLSMPTNSSQSWMSRIDLWHFEYFRHRSQLSKSARKPAGGGAPAPGQQISFVKNFAEHSNSSQSIPRLELLPKMLNFQA